jgi:hypothetical protein
MTMRWTTLGGALLLGASLAIAGAARAADEPMHDDRDEPARFETRSLDRDMDRDDDFARGRSQSESWETADDPSGTDPDDPRAGRGARKMVGDLDDES